MRALRYLGRRFAFCLGTVIVLSTLIFVILYVWPLDPATAIQQGTGGQDLSAVRSELGLTRPLSAQYRSFLTRGLTFDYTTSWVLGPDDEPDKYVRMQQRVPRTLWVTALAVPVAVAVLRVSRRRGEDLSVSALLARSLPGFGLALVARGVLVEESNPLGITWNTFLVDTANFAASSASNRPPPIVLFDPHGLLVALKWYGPAGLALGGALGSTLLVLRYVAVGAESDRPYVALARAKGLSPDAVSGHTSRNATLSLALLLPALVNVYVGTLLVVEDLLNVEGVGELFVTAVAHEDVPLLGSLAVGFVVVLAAAVFVRDITILVASGVDVGRYARHLGFESSDRWRPSPAPLGSEGRLRPSVPRSRSFDRLLSRVRSNPRPAAVWVSIGVVLVGLEVGALASAVLELPPWTPALSLATGLLGDMGAGPVAALLTDVAAVAADVATAVSNLPTLLSRGVVPNRGYWTGSGYVKTFFGTSPALSWAIRLALVGLYVVALCAWLALGYRVYRLSYRLADRTATDELLSSLRTNRLALAGLAVAVGFVAFAVFAPTVGPATGPRSPVAQEANEYLKQSFKYYDRQTGSVRTIRVMFADSESQSGPFTDTDVGAMRYDDFGRFHPFGTTYEGRDLFTRMAFAARSYLVVGALATAATGLFALVAAFVAARRERVAVAVSDASEAVPMLPTVLVVGIAFQNTGLGSYLDGGLLLVCALALLLWTPLWRGLRGALSHNLDAPWSDSARLTGATSVDVVRRHALAPLAGRVTGAACTLFAGMLLSVQSLAYVRSFGVFSLDLWSLSWPNLSGSWHIALFPTVGFFLIVLGFAALGTALRQAASVPGQHRPDPAGELAGVGTGG